MQPVLLYDADCGFCTRTAWWLRDHGLRADLAPIGGAGTAHLGVDLDRARREVPFVDNAGRVWYGADAAVEALRHCPAPLSCLGRLGSPGLLRPLLRGIYALVAANRHRLPGGSQACSLNGRPDLPACDSQR